MKFSLAPTPIQAELLRRVAADPGAQIESSKSNTLWALEQRRLVKRSRPILENGTMGMTAVLTDEGRYFLKHGRHPEEVEREAQRAASDPDAVKEAPVDGTDLVRRVSAAGGTLIVQDPGVMTRGRWKRAYYEAVNRGDVPAGHKLRLSGREHGDLTVRLEGLAEEAPVPPMPTVVVPAELSKSHPLIIATRKALGRAQTGMADTRGRPGIAPIYVSRTLVDRALRIMQALIMAVEERGHTVETRARSIGRRDPTHLHEFVVVVGGHAYPLELRERTSKQPHEPTPQELRDAEREPAWMRKRIPKYDNVLDGRLMIDTPIHQGTYNQRLYDCSDGARTMLESRLGHLIAAIEARAVEAEAAKAKAAQAEEARKQHWYATLEQARQLLIRDHRLKTLDEQLAARRTAGEIRSLCAAVRAQANGDFSSSAAEWLNWGEAHADSIDPVLAGVALPPDPAPTRQSLEPYIGTRGVFDYPWPYERS